MRYRARGALLDIEGTLGSIAFVRDVLFPFASARMDAFVREYQTDPIVAAVLDQTADEADVSRDDLDALLEALHDWADRDVKITPLKTLQGLIWVEGYASSGLVGHLYPDAIDALHRFHGGGAALSGFSRPRPRLRSGAALTLAGSVSSTPPKGPQ